MTLDGVNLSQLVERLRPFFLSSSVGTPPLSSGGSGGRIIANTQVTDKTILALVNGAVTWTFAAKFTVKPVVSIAPEGTPPSAGTNLYIDTIGANAVIIKSTDATDHRVLHLRAEQQ